MARVRVQGETGRSEPARAANRAVSSSSRLVDVVRSVRTTAAGSMVHHAASTTAAWRPRDRVAPEYPSVSRPSAALPARPLLSVLVHDTGGTTTNGSVVEPAAGRRVRSRDHARSLRPIAAAATQADDHAH